MIQKLRWPIDSRQNFILTLLGLFIILSFLLAGHSGKLAARQPAAPAPTATPTPGAWLKPAQVPREGPGPTPAPTYAPPVAAAMGFGTAFSANLPQKEWHAGVKKWSTPAWGAILSTVDPANVPNLFGVPKWSMAGQAEGSQVVRLSWFAINIDVTVVRQPDGSYLVDNAEPS